MSDSEWMDQKNCPISGFPHIFLSMLFRSIQFYCYLTATVCTSLVEEAPKQDVVILCLPPHTTADSQPSDTSVFGPLKVHWSEACHEYMSTHPDRIVMKFQFSTLFRQAWSKTISIENIYSSFKSTGVYPFNPEEILKNFPASPESASDNTASSVEPEKDQAAETEEADELDTD